MSFSVKKKIEFIVDNENGERLELCPYPEAPEMGLILHTPDRKSEEWFGGPINLIMSPEEAQVIGESLIQMSKLFEPGERIK